MEEPLGRRTSPSRDNALSSGGEPNNGPTIMTALDDRLLDISTRHSTNVLRTTPAKKAKRVRFFRNGDKFYTGVVMAVTPERYRSFDSLATDLTRALISSVTLPSGVRAIYTMDGRKVQSINDLEDGKCYVVAGQGEIFKKVEYSSSKVRRGGSLSGLPQSPAGTGRAADAIPVCLKARIVTLIRHGTKPRRVVRLLLNKRNAPSLEHALEAITNAVKLDSGAVRKVYTISGKHITTLEQFFENENVFLAYGNEKSTQEDFELDFEESKLVQSFRKGLSVSRKQTGPMPRMPKKSGKKAIIVPVAKTSKPSSLSLPEPLMSQYTVGHVIGEGTFAVVRHCVLKSSGVGYAMKIIDKYKCEGKETMLASEVAILRQLCHPNIIRLITEEETTDQLFLVMELVTGGDLFDAIAAATKFSEAEASIMIGHLMSALAYLHSHHIVHRDVKPENLLVEVEGKYVRCLKLGDFGLAQYVREPLYAICGTPTYVAPEILAESGYGLKIDVWAAGVILYILLCGFPPFVSPEREQEELFERILNGQYEFNDRYWGCISDSAKELISNMLQTQPELRFSAEDVLDHPWLTSFLGDEPTATATDQSSEQYGDQQRQPIGLATFCLNDFSAGGIARAGNDNGVGSDVRSSRSSDGSWSKLIRTMNANNEDEVELMVGSSGDVNDGEPISLSTDCLQDIRTVTRSLHDLTFDLDGCTGSTALSRTRSCRRKSRSGSSNSISDAMNSPRKNGNAGIFTGNAHTGPKKPQPVERFGRLRPRRENPNLYSKKQAPSRGNGNSLSNIHSKSSATPSPPPDHLFGRNIDTPKSARASAKKPNYSKVTRREIYSSSDIPTL